MVIIFPILTAIYGSSYWLSEDTVKGPVDFLLSWVFPGVATLCFWVVKQATPGKMAVSAKIVNARTGEPAGTGQLIGRYFAYILSMLPFGLGYIWIAFDGRKQGWHDKLSGTVVVRNKNRGTEPVAFDR